MAGVRTPTGRTAPHGSRRGQWLDQFLGSDPGLNRFRSALMSVVSIGLILLAEFLFVRATHALQLGTAGVPASGLPAVAMANHEYLVIMMLLGAIIGMISAFGIIDPRARGQFLTMVLLPIPMLAALTLGIALGQYRVLSLVLLAVVLAVGTYLRRFGPRGMVAGMLLFMGFFFGFFLHGAVTLHDFGWLASAVGVGVVVAMVVRFGLFFPHPAKALARTQRSFGARARKVAALALVLIDAPEDLEGTERRLNRQLVRLNEAALMIDGQLGDPDATTDGSSGQLLHQRLFDAELALTNTARFAQAMGQIALPANQRSAARSALLAVVRGDTEGARSHAEELLDLLASADSPSPEDATSAIIPHRFAISVVSLTDAWTEWISLGGAEGPQSTFQPAVNLFGGWLPGSAQVSASASLERGHRAGEKVGLAPYTRTAIQMGVAVGVAIALGDLVSGRRFYWAVIAAFITFMGVNNSGEQARKALFRVGGTVVGIGIGSLLAEAVGHDAAWSITVILVSLFFGFYLMRVNYAFMVIGITVMVSQLYVQLNEFSNSLLLLRLAETAIGAGVAIVVVMVVLPLRTRRVLRVALRSHVQAVEHLVDHASLSLLGDGAVTELRGDARDVDATYQALVATAQPLRRNLFGNVDEATGRALRMASASRNYSRNLVVDVEALSPIDAGLRQDLERASATLQASIETVADAVTGSRDRTYARSSALFDRAERRLEERSHTVEGGRLAIRDLRLIDGAMANLAEVMGLEVTDFDTTLVGARR